MSREIVGLYTLAGHLKVGWWWLVIKDRKWHYPVRIKKDRGLSVEKYFERQKQDPWKHNPYDKAELRPASKLEFVLRYGFAPERLLPYIKLHRAVKKQKEKRVATRRR